MKKAITILLVVLLAGGMLLFAGCGGRDAQFMTLNELASRDSEDFAIGASFHQRHRLDSYGGSPPGMDMDMDDVSYSMAVQNTATSPEEEAAAQDSTAGRMLIRDVNASVETRRFEDYMASIQARTAEVGGHVQNIETHDRGYFGSGTRRANLVLRIPADALDDFTEALGENGHVTSMHEFVRDVTMQHNDMQAELEALFVERDALLRLMDTAGELGDLLAVQNNLTRVRHQINRLEGEVRLLENQVSLSTVSLSIREVERIVDTEQGFWARTWQGFADSIRGLGNWIASVFAGLIMLLPWLVFFGLIALVAFLIVRKKLRQRRQRRLEARESL